MASALGNLMANYTDSEGEELAEGGSEGEGEGNPSLADRLSRLEAPTNATGTPNSSASATSNKSTPVKKAALVSYHDPDAGLSDEERSPVPMDLESDAEVDGDGNEEEAEAEEARKKAEAEKIHIMEELWQEGVKLPPEPPGQCSKELQEKFEGFWKNKVERGVDYNRIIQGKKAFRNPSIYEKLIIHCNIEELGTNFPPHLYDGHLFGKESYYEELGKVQKTEMDKREKALEAKKKLGESAKSGNAAHRKSKWDIQGMSRATSGTGTAGTVISAFGSLNKKK